MLALVNRFVDATQCLVFIDRRGSRVPDPLSKGTVSIQLSSKGTLRSLYWALS